MKDVLDINMPDHIPAVVNPSIETIAYMEPLGFGSHSAYVEDTDGTVIRTDIPRQVDTFETYTVDEAEEFVNTIEDLLQMVRAVGENTFQPKIGFKTRYGLVSNPFTSISADSNSYYRLVTVTNLM